MRTGDHPIRARDLYVEEEHQIPNVGKFAGSDSGGEGRGVEVHTHNPRCESVGQFAWEEERAPRGLGCTTRRAGWYSTACRLAFRNGKRIDTTAV